MIRYFNINDKIKLELELIVKKDFSYRVRAKAILLRNDKRNINKQNRDNKYYDKANQIESIKA